MTRTSTSRRPLHSSRPQPRTPTIYQPRAGEDLLALDAAELVPLLERTLLCGVPAFLRGHPGIGKSDIARAVARRLNRRLVDIRLSQMEAAEIHGIYMPTEDHTRLNRVPMDWVQVVAQEPCLLFLDELNAAPTKAHQAAAYQLLLDRVAAGVPFHPDTLVLAAGNLDGDRAIVGPLSNALKNRLAHFILRPSAAAWLEWAEDADVDPRVVAFIRAHGDRVLYRASEDHAFATPRSWVHLGHLIGGGGARSLDAGRAEVRTADLDPVLDLGMVQLLATSCVGVAMARAFVEFLETSEYFNADDILRLGRWPDLTRGRASEISARMRLVDELLVALRGIVTRHRAELRQRHVRNVVAFLSAEGMTEELRWRFVRRVEDDGELGSVLAEFGEYDELAQRVRKEAPVQ